MKRKFIPIESDKLCRNGCGRLAKFVNLSGKLFCEDWHTKCPINKTKNSKGLKKSYEQGTRISYDYISLPQETKDRMSHKGNYKADFSYGGKGNHKKLLIKERGHLCQRCKLNTWLNEPIPLELEHKDGNNKNNQKDNLELLCPNCHAKTKFYRGRNTNTGSRKVSDELLLTFLEKGYNIRQTLMQSGLTPKGKNYDRVKNLYKNSLV